MTQKDELVSSLRRAKYADLLPEYKGLSYLEGEARLTDGGVSVNGELIGAPKVIITTAALPAVSLIQATKDVEYLTSTTAHELKALPRSLLAISTAAQTSELQSLMRLS